MLSFVLYSGLTFNFSTATVKSLNTPVPKVVGTNLYQWNDLLNISDYTAQSDGHWYIINIWASWCEACQDEHPFLMDLARQGVTIFGIDYNDSAISAKKWLQSYGNPYKSVIWDARGIVGGRLRMSSLPTTYLVDPQGNIRSKVTGPLKQSIWQDTFIPIIEKNGK